MKIRKGFVSNSSSSSFIVTVKDEKYTKEQIENHNKKILCDNYGPIDEDKEYIDQQVKKYKNQYILYIGSVEYGAEESVEKVTLELLKHMGYKKNQIKINYDE